MGWHVGTVSLVFLVNIYGFCALPLMNDTTDEPRVTMNEAMHYLHKYDYLTMEPESEIGEISSHMTEAIIQTIRLFQENNKQYGLQVTGELDAPTVALMQLPRCGVRDVISTHDQPGSRHRRYVLAGGKWDKKTLTYKVLIYPQDRDMSVSEVDSEIARAFKVWQDVTPLRFVKLAKRDPRRADIDIKFVPSYIDHGDGRKNAFDGESGTLAHAFYPLPGAGPIAGDSHFDEAETWTLYTTQGTNLFQVAAHEFGHALGLEHSKDPDALMAPYYRGYIPNFKLPADDVRGIQALYGAPQNKRQEGLEFVCGTGSFDAITTIKDGSQEKTFGFKGPYYFQMDEGGILNSFPKLIKKEWPKLPNKIDAALFLPAKYSSRYDASKRRQVRVETSPAVTFIFKGHQYWKINSMKIERGYPRRISDWGIPSFINAAFFNKRDGRIYFIKGSKYFAFIKGRGLVERGRSLAGWRGLPSRVDATLPGSSGVTYFFKGSRYYALNHKTDSVEGGFPKSTNIWTKCHQLHKSG